MQEFFAQAAEEFYYTVGISYYAVLLILAILYIGLKETMKWKKYILVVSPLVIILLVILNPIYGSILAKISDYSYYRLFWLVPADLILAYAIVRIWSDIKQQYKKRIFAGVMIVVLVFCGHFVTAAFRVTHHDNLYQIHEENIILADAIMEDDTYAEKLVMAQEAVGQMIRPYRAEILICVYNESYLKMAETVVAEMTARKCTYGVYTKECAQRCKLDECTELKKIAETDNYSVYVLLQKEE